jgi:phage shock protein C
MKRLMLSRTDRKLAGVCGGIAEYFEMDSTIVRLLTAVIAVMTALFPVLIAYALAWLIIPTRQAG